MFPEPDATGSGDVAADTNAASNDVPDAIDKEATTSTGNEFLDAFNQVDVEETEKATEQQINDVSDDYDLGDINELGLDEEEAAILRSAGRESGASPQQAIKLVTSIRKSISERTAKLEEEAGKALQKDWGMDYSRKVKDTATFIKRVGAANGWSDSDVKSVCTPQGFRMFNAVMNYVNAGKHSVGSQTSVHAEPQEDKESLRKQSIAVANDFFIARSKGDRQKMRDLREQHYQIRRKLDGRNAVYQLHID